MKINGFVKTAAVALVVAGAAGAASARSNVHFSIGANIAPGVVIGASSGGYYPPVYSSYVQPIYYAPAPVYYAPTYYAPSYYVRPAPVIYVPRYYHRPHRVVRYYGPRYHY